MQFYVVVSITPEGSEALVGHYLCGSDYRCEAFDFKDDADEMCEDMTRRFADRGMQYEVREVNV